MYYSPLLAADGHMVLQLLNGRRIMNIFITGGDKGIGRALVESLSSDEKNKVFFTYNKNIIGAEELCSSNANTTAYQCDLRHFESCKAIVTDLKKNNQFINVLINNAGYDHDSTFLKMEKFVWDDVIDVNLKTIYNFSRLLIPEMVTNYWGRVINLTSIAGFKGAFGKSNYSAAKAGIAGFTKSLALELATKGITVNAIAPGAIETDMLYRIPDKYREKILEEIPMKRFGKPSEVADLISFLISEKASYITGQTIHINGGSFL
jgi:NAD(P)-dependent dehydrogenase (short-subunit alcohol dehydrogenase family)